MWAWVPTEVLIARGYKIFDAGESSLIQIKAPQRNRAVTVLLLLGWSLNAPLLGTSGGGYGAAAMARWGRAIRRRRRATG
jgi:hypothetical protein